MTYGPDVQGVLLPAAVEAASLHDVGAGFVACVHGLLNAYLPPWLWVNGTLNADHLYEVNRVAGHSPPSWSTAVLRLGFSLVRRVMILGL